MSLDAKEQLIRAVLRLVSSERDESHANYDAELEYCNEMLFEAAAAYIKSCRIS